MGGVTSGDSAPKPATIEHREELADHDRLPGIQLVTARKLSRRRFVSYASRVGIALAAVPGVLVGWAPSAEAISNCAPGTYHEVTPNRCRTSCIGHCSNYFSYCSCNTVHPGVCFQACNCLSYCGAARAVVVCHNWRGVGCCQYC